MSDKYLSMKSYVNGFSFANLGLFYGFGNGIVCAVYALVLMDIFHNSSIVGLYTSLSYGFVMLLALISGEFFRRFTKTRIFYYSMFIAGTFAFMMAFSIRPITFIVLDQLAWLPWLLISYSIPLFLTDFSKGVGMARLSGRYYTWLNLGAFVAPMVAMFFAGRFGNRSAYFVVSAIMFAGLIYFNKHRVVTADKPIKKLVPRRTMRSVLNNLRVFFKRPVLVKAYLIKCGYYALAIIENIYIPIIIMENGFSKDTLGLLLSACIIPYIIAAIPISRLAKKYGSKGLVACGFMLAAAAAVFAIFVSGYALLGLFILFNVSRAMIEPLRDLLFYDNVSKADSSRFIGIYNTGGNVPKFIIPLICAGIIATTKMTNLVWMVYALFAIVSAVIMILPVKGKEKIEKKK